MAKYTIAEHWTESDGSQTYVLEYEREGSGIQRPTFNFPKGTSFDDAATEMRNAINEERALNEKPSERKKGKDVGKEI